MDYEIFVEAAEGFTVDDLPPSASAYVLLLKKALEGIRQGAALWFKLCRSAILKLGGQNWINEANLYYFPEIGVRMGVFADDIVIGYTLVLRRMNTLQ